MSNAQVGIDGVKVDTNTLIIGPYGCQDRLPALVATTGQGGIELACPEAGGASCEVRCLP